MPEFTPRIWQVGPLCRAVADALDARFNPVAVRGEISGFTRAPSGHAYFSLKDVTGQIRCVMFKRAFGMIDFAPRDGAMVEVRGRLGLYEPRGDLQLVVESMTAAGAGALFEQFVRLKLKLEAEGLFDAQRKRVLPAMPRGIGVVTSLGAAALHDVLSALARRVPHIPVVVASASVQGAGAPAELTRALEKLYALAAPMDRILSAVASEPRPSYGPAPDVVVDAILLVRGGGSMEDLWAFNDEALARAIVRSPVPVLSGVGHETDFTIADFVSDLRAPTPTAAAELVAEPRDTWLGVLDLLQERLGSALSRCLDAQGQRVDNAAARLGRPSTLVAVQRTAVQATAKRMRQGVRSVLQQHAHSLRQLRGHTELRLQGALAQTGQRLGRAQLRLELLDPALVLQRGYAWLSDEEGRTITGPDQVAAGQRIHAAVARGAMELQVLRDG